MLAGRKSQLRLMSACLFLTPLLNLAASPDTSNALSQAPEVAEPFRAYYSHHQGARVLGNPLTGLLQVSGYPAQYFEKGRLEDHRRDGGNPEWAYSYGRLPAEMSGCDPRGQVTDLAFSYAGIQIANSPARRHQPPAGFPGGTAAVKDAIFVPFDAGLRPAPGYIVPLYFWNYINRADLFPGGWLHDVGLPMMDATETQAFKETQYANITIQAFERAVLTYDPQNPPEWQVERANVGVDAVKKLPKPRKPGIEVPAARARVTLPLHIAARVGRPCEAIDVTLMWSNGTILSRTFTAQRGEDGRGLLVVNLDWPPGEKHPHPPTQSATLQLRNRMPGILAVTALTVLHPNDPDTVSVKLFWVNPKKVLEYDRYDWLEPEIRRIPKTTRIATAAMEELLWGPREQSGLSTSIPLPSEVLAYGEDYSDSSWGPRVRLLSLTIEQGIAMPNFSREINAYGGGSARVAAIGRQITKTAMQFPSVRAVRVAVEGETEAVLQP
jgi:hypothetical protein